MGKYYLGTGTQQINFQVVDSTGVINDLNLSGLYLSVTGKAADADKLDNFDSSYFRNAANLTGVYTGLSNGTATGVFSGIINTVDYIKFRTGLGINPDPTQLTWSDDIGTMQLGLDAAVDLRVGFQNYEFVTNRNAATLNKGSVVYVTGAQGNRPAVALALANADATSAVTFGILAENIASMADGYAITNGLLTNINTTGFSEGAALYLSPTVSGEIVSTKPQAPNHGVLVGFCVRSHASVGEILVKIQNGVELDELHDVRIIAAQNNDIIRYSAPSGVWYNSNTLALNGTGSHYVSGNLGIGTSAPTAKLDVYGGASATPQTYVLARAGSFTTAIGAQDSSGVAQESFVGSLTNNDFKFKANNTEYMRLTAGGNLGIGTAAPQTSVEIFKNTTSGKNIFHVYNNSSGPSSTVGIGWSENDANGGNYNSYLYTVRTPTSEVRLDATTNNRFVIRTGTSGSVPTERMTVLSGGNVGIGTTSPGSKLDVSGQISVSAGSEAAPSYTFTSDLDTGLYSPTANQLNIVTGAVTRARFNSTEIRVGTNLSTSDLGVESKFIIVGSENTPILGSLIASLGFSNDSNQAGQTSAEIAKILVTTQDSTANQGRLEFQTKNGTTLSTRMLIDKNGNVGIGQTSPSYRLEVETGSSDADGIRVRDSAVGVWTDIRRRYIECSGADFWINSQSSFLDLRTANVSKLFIALNGNVGIGTTSPSLKFVVNGGNANIENITGSVIYTPSALNTSPRLTLTGQYATTGTYNVIRYSSGAAHDWSVGTVTQSSGDADYVFQSRAGSTYSEKVRITSVGNVGIGTATASAKLEVALTSDTSGEATAWDNKYAVFGTGGSSTAGGIFFSYDQTNNRGYIGALTPGTSWRNLILQPNAAGGNVGIGTKTPAYRLEVNGSFAATTKSFVILHPTKEGKKLRYGSLEGPENGVYVRGKTTSKVIELPDYWTKLVDPDSISVQLTPIGSHQKLYVEKIENNKVYIANENLLAKNINCFFCILAERADVEKLKVEIDA